MAQAGAAEGPASAESPTVGFPPLEDDDPSHPAERVQFEKALLPEENGTAVTAAPKIPGDINSSTAPRLDVNKSRGQTDPSHDVFGRTASAQSQHNSTDARGHGRQANAAEPPSSDSDEEDSSDDNNLNLRRSQSQPDYKPFSTSRLNQVYRRPARTITEQPGRKKRVRVGNAYFTSLGRVARDGRLTISVSEAANSGYIAKALGATISSHLRPHDQSEADEASKQKAQKLQSKGQLQVPRLNIVIMVIGSRGDIQPFLKIGKILQDKHHHRVRIATHPTFRKFVEEDVGLEFFSVGGDPSELMAFMVKNPGLLPSVETIKAGEISKRRDSMFEMFQGFWRACINSTDDETDVSNLKMLDSRYPFTADAIIANPPSFAHFCCAERLGIPLHLVFTFPYTPTMQFPHPLANIKSTNVDQSYTNFMSYPLVDLMTWQGLGDLVNRFRVNTLGLEPVSTLWAPGQLSRLKVPMTYLWSPGLVPKPSDWGPEIDIAGYVFLDLASKFKPPEDLAKFLERSDDRAIIYIGFGSIAGIEDPTAFTKMIFEAVEKANVRAIISRGWGGMGDGMQKPDGVFMIDNVPHDWLFPKVDAVVHHGGAGTTAAGLKFGKPTMIVPFFGDQPFWSAMVAKAGAGAKQALPLRKLNTERFAEGIRQCLEPDAKTKAQAIAESIEKEGDGAENAVDSFHRSLLLEGDKSMRCCIFSDRVAVWSLEAKRTNLRLSNLAAELLVENEQLHWADLQLIRHREWMDFQGPGEPITGAGGVLVSAFQDAFQGLCSIPESTKRDLARHEKQKRKKKGKSVADAMALPGHIAFATRGTSAETARKKARKLDAEMNLRGDAAPRRRPFSVMRSSTTKDSGRTGLYRTDTSSTAEHVRPVIVLKDFGRGMREVTKAVVRLPSRMWWAGTLGMRNAPKLYGDKTVRPTPYRITGFRSGCKVAGSEFYHGFYDGVTGLVRLPQIEVLEKGKSGLLLGVGMGIGGLVIKPIAGTMGLTAYPGKGFFVSMRKRFRDTQRTQRWIRKARISQGVKDVEELKHRDETNQDPQSPDAPHEDELEEARSKVLKVWTSQQQNGGNEIQEKKEAAPSAPDQAYKAVAGRAETF